ncbi:MAG: hypothetical protein FIB03_00665 [Anaerolineae bacterium]|nr:hypothetical protein [Anaerolineae bacterium]
MTTLLLSQLGIIPAILIALTGLLILRGEDKERNTPRFLLFLLGVMVLFQLALFIIRRYFTEPYNQPIFQATWLLAPSILGILALILLNAWTAWINMNRGTRMAAGLLALVMAFLFALNRDSQWGLEFLILPGALILSIGWALGRPHPRLAVILSLFSIAVLLFTNWIMTHPPDYDNPNVREFGMVLFPLFYIVPGLSVVMSAVLFTDSLTQEEESLSRFHRAVKITFSASLILYLAYIIYWGSIWDHTDDGLLGLSLVQPSAITAIGAGMVMILATRGKSRPVGLLFMLIVPVMLNQSFERGWRVSYHEITEGRAERIAGALDQFKEREGHYPESLNELSPRDLLFIQQPMILAGEKWCYESDGNYYRLAAFYREFFSAPVSLRLYKSAGDVPTSPIPSEERLAEMKGKYYSPMEDPNAMQPPTPAPLPTSVVNTQRQTVQPIVRAPAVSVGKWSPDGMYLVLGLPRTSGNQSAMSLSFLKADSGEICPASETQQATGMEDGVREHFAWLPDGRLLYVPASGEMALLSPCEPDSVSLTDSYPVTFTHALDYHEGTGRVLLKNQNSFWILDGHNLEAIQLPNVTPNPFDLHWDHFDWSPEGNRIAISRLNGRTAREGSTLFIVNGTTGAVEYELPMEDATDQSAPMVIWTSEEELLFSGDNALFLVDFSVVPPKFIDVLRDIFLLDISYPNDVSTFAWEGHHISIRVNHPRNQGIYVFHPETSQVEIIQPKSASPLLFFPNGEMVEMANYIGDPPSEDIYELIWVDAPDTASPIITVQGHLPRNYPNLFPRYLPESSQLAFSSSQGVSLVSIPDGETVGFWELAGGGGYSSYVVPPSAYPALVVVADGDGLYYIPLR